MLKDLQVNEPHVWVEHFVYLPSVAWGFFTPRSTPNWGGEARSSLGLLPEPGRASRAPQPGAPEDAPLGAKSLRKVTRWIYGAREPSLSTKILNSRRSSSLRSGHGAIHLSLNCTFCGLAVDPVFVILNRKGHTSEQSASVKFTTGPL